MKNDSKRKLKLNKKTVANLVSLADTKNIRGGLTALRTFEPSCKDTGALQCVYTWSCVETECMCPNSVDSCITCPPCG